MNINFVPPAYICYNVKICGSDILSSSSNVVIDLFDNKMQCQFYNSSNLSEEIFYNWDVFINRIYTLFYTCSTFNHLSSMLNLSNLYTCANSSKIISQHRLLDKIEDCLYGDDESYANSCSLNGTNHRFTCKVKNKTICFSPVVILDGFVDCDDGSDEKDQSKIESERTISFQTMCDGMTELFPIIIDGRNETDETECQYFSCNNLYTRCNGVWNCIDGIDEINCEWPPLCPSLHHMCISSITNNLICLSLERVNDNIIDCFGASDERGYCHQSSNNYENYRCSNSSRCIDARVVCTPMSLDSCSTNVELPNDFCEDTNGGLDLYLWDWSMEILSHFTQLLLTFNRFNQLRIIHFSLIVNPSYSSLKGIQRPSISGEIISPGNEINNYISKVNMSMVWYCNRGIMIRRLINNKNAPEVVCLCPPSYYGRMCEYQNERVSLTIQIKVSSDWRTVFAIVITLRDNEQNLIESSDQLEYLPVRDCNKKMFVYLLYSTRPKNQSKTYTVRFDVYNKDTFEYRASWAFPVVFSFLPVQRLAIQIQIPSKKSIPQECKTLKCGINGYCLKYVNSDKLFCQCNKGWSGLHCNIEHQCYCSSDSVCLDSKICLCRSRSFGSRCYLNQSICLCENNGSCLQNDIRLMEKTNFWCNCPEGFSGLTCEKIDRKIFVSFESTLSIQSLLIFHFIEVFGPMIPHIHTTVLKKLSFDKDTITISRSNPFNIIFIEVGKTNFYLILLEIEKSKSSTNTSLTVTMSNRCLSLSELFNSSFVAMHLLRRMKYYHLPCQQRTNLKCFYDDQHMCLCNDTLKQANCFPFNHSMEKFDCQGENLCENGGSCFHDQSKCPTLSTCICDDCSYGSRCQFSTKSFDLSLETILGYQIRPNQSITQQRASIKITIAIVIIMLLCGLLSNILSIMAFSTTKAREVGCGYYLLTSSFISILIFILFTLKFFLLMGFQMGSIINRSYLLLNCLLIDFLLKSLLSLIDWLYICVSIERCISVIKDSPFNKTKSKSLSKWIIFGICLFILVTYIHDPIHRRLFDDEDENRTWCIVQYSSSLKIYDSMILLIHFFLPFLINIISSIFIIFRITRHKSILQKQLTYKKQLRKQFSNLKHLLISPFILIVLDLPQLIISFSSGCMKSPRDPWLYLAAYFTSFISAMLILFIFVLPSNIYKTELKNSIQRIRQYFSFRK